MNPTTHTFGSNSGFKTFLILICLSLHGGVFGCCLLVFCCLLVQDTVLGLSSLSTFGPIGATLEIVLILYPYVMDSLYCCCIMSCECFSFLSLRYQRHLSHARSIRLKDATPALLSSLLLLHLNDLLLFFSTNIIENNSSAVWWIFVGMVTVFSSLTVCCKQ